MPPDEREGKGKPFRSDDEIVECRKARTRRRLDRDIVEICITVVVAFSITYLILRSVSDSRGGTIDANSLLLSSLTIACIAGWVATVAVLLPGGSDDIRDRED